MEPTILVTGATGLVGNNVVRQLLDQGRRVRVLVRETSDHRPLDGLNIERVCGDIGDQESVRRACRGASCVIHSAGYVQIGHRQLAIHREINVEGSRNVARAAREAGIRMIHVSSVDALGVRSLREPSDETNLAPMSNRCAYVIGKREAEQAVLEEHAQGLDVVITNPGFMLGPWDWKPSSGRMLVEVAKGRGLLAPRGHFSVCDVRDVAAAIIAAIEKGRSGQRYILAGHTMSYLETWRLFAQITGARKPLFAPGPAILWIGGQLGDLFGWMAGKEYDLNSAAIAVARLPKAFSSDKAKRELGYRMRPVLESAQAAYEWFREYGYL